MPSGSSSGGYDLNREAMGGGCKHADANRMVEIERPLEPYGLASKLITQQWSVVLGIYRKLKKVREQLAQELDASVKTIWG